MLSESMLRKFTSKIEKLAENQQSQRSQSPRSRHEQVQSCDQSQERQETPIKKITNLTNSRRLRSSNVEDNNQALIGNDSIHEENNQQVSEKNQTVINIDQKTDRSQKIDTKQLSRLIALQKQKAQNAQKLQNTTPSTTQGTIRKTTAPPAKPANNVVITKQPPPQAIQGSAVKPAVVIQMPKVAVMNNLIKLSDKLNIKELLKQVKYQAKVISMAPMRLLLYFCIQKIIYFMYQTNGHDKMTQNLSNAQFLQKQIQLGLVQLLSYIKHAERTMISRILKGIFNRFGILPVYSQKWLTQCIKNNKKAIQNAGIKNVEQIQSLPTNNHITSQIFSNIPEVEKKINYSNLSIQLEDEQSCKQRVLDPEVQHSQQKLFFFKKGYKKQKQRYQQVEIDLDDQENNQIQQNQYQQSNFAIQIFKQKIPQNTKIYTNNKNQRQFEMNQGHKGKNRQLSEQKDQIVSKRRGRAQRVQGSFDIQQHKIDDAQYRKQPNEALNKQKLFNIIQEYVFSNISSIADKVAQKWKIRPEQIRQLIKQSGQSRAVPQKAKPQMNTSTSVKLKNKSQTDQEIIKEIDAKSQELQRSGVSHKQLVKQVFKLLQSKNLSHQEKQQVMQKWIALKRQKKLSNR